MPPNASDWLSGAAGARAGKIILTLVRGESINAPWRNALLDLARALSVVQDGLYDNISHPLQLAETLRNDKQKLAEILESVKNITQAIQAASADAKLKGEEQLIALEKEMTDAVAESRAIVEDLRATAAAQSTKQQSLSEQEELYENAFQENTELKRQLSAFLELETERDSLRHRVAASQALVNSLNGDIVSKISEIASLKARSRATRTSVKKLPGGTVVARRNCRRPGKSWRRPRQLTSRL